MEYTVSVLVGGVLAAIIFILGVKLGDMYSKQKAKQLEKPYDPRDKWPDLIMVANPGERQSALEAGWDSKDIVYPRIMQMEGRRYKTLLITWPALEALHNSPDNYAILDRLHSDQILMGTKVQLNWLLRSEEI